MNYKHLVILICACMLASMQGTEWWQFPVSTISAPECKHLERKDHAEHCKVALSDVYNQYDGNTSPVGQLVMSVLYGASYTAPHSPEVWGHPWVDIVSAKGTPVYAIGPGEVVKAWELFGFGNSITLKHLYNDSYIYSSYSHLSKIAVKVGDYVVEGQNIWEIGRTGNTTGKRGNHLEFQLTNDQSPSHPYGYHDCPWGYRDAVENGTCRDKMKKYTIDPLAFFMEPFDYQTAIIHSSATHTSYIELPEIETEKILPEPTPDEIEEETVNAPADNVLTDDSNYLVSSSIRTAWDTLSVSTISKLTIQIVDPTTWDPISGTLEKRMSIVYDKDYLTVLPHRFSTIIKWKKDSFIKAKQAGSTDIEIFYGEQHIATHTVVIK